MTIALVINNQIVEYRELELTDIPEHKRNNWLPVVNESVNYNPEYQNIEKIVIIDSDKVRRTWQITAKSIDEVRATRLTELWNNVQLAIDAAEVTVTISGVDYQFGCDTESRENIMGINLAIVSGLPIPNPRTWKPRGINLPIECTHQELLLIGGATLARKDELMQTYFIKRAYINDPARTPQEIAEYDITI